MHQDPGFMTLLTQRVAQKGVHYALSHVRLFFERLGVPLRYSGRVVHVAGTNGKGSTLAFLKSWPNSALCNRR